MFRFYYDYKHSKFIECNSALQKQNSKILNGTYIQNLKLNEKIKPCLAYIAEYFESLHKNYWLSSGTLLGWYRDCGIIPFTEVHQNLI